jgi:ABC-type amino acid transport substrate-binding protein
LTGLFTFFGSTFVAVPFLLDLFRIPADTFQLFVILDNLVSNRFGALLASMHVLSLALLSACAVGKLVSFSWAKVIRYAVLTVVFTVVVLGGIRLTFESLAYEYDKYDLFIGRSFLYEPVERRVLQAPPDTIVPIDKSMATLDRIKERGFIRVGYGTDDIPYVFRNETGELVGVDVEMAHQLARELNTTIEFVRIDMGDMPRLLDSGYLDVVMSGLAVTTENMKKIAYSAPYLDETLCFIVKDHRREEFSSQEAVYKLEAPRLAIPNVPYYIAKVQDYLPQAEIVPIESPREFFRGKVGDVDALVYGAVSGSCWCLIYPAYSVAVPHPDIILIPLAYAVSRDDREMVDFLSTWIELKKRDGTIESLFDYWILGKKRAGATRRWSVIKDVLGWIG